MNDDFPENAIQRLVDCGYPVDIANKICNLYVEKGEITRLMTFARLTEIYLNENSLKKQEDA